MNRNKHKKSTQPRGESAYLPEWLVKHLDFPPDVLHGGMRVELRGRELLLVEGCCQILVYTPTLVKLRMKHCVLVIEGERMLCHSYLSGAVGLEGKIKALFLEEGCVC